jgi:hypothetical protein
MAIEKPTYSVLTADQNFEIRQYDEYWIAECHMPGVTDLSAASSRAFSRLFGYISGENSASQKIAMTSPVQQIPSELGWSVSFVVPKDVALDSIPAPTNSTIAIRKVEAGKYAALRYSGLWNEQRFQQKSAELLKAVADAGYTTAGPVSSAFYNPPFTPPFLRRNEVLVPLQG